MRNNDYALSYNVKAQVLDILKSIYNFETWNRADKFVTWFNKVVDAKGKVTIADICSKYKREAIEAYGRIGFDDAIYEDDIFEMTRSDGSEYYQILFPVLKDFTMKGV